MTSKQSDLEDRRYRQRTLDEALEADRRGRDRLPDLADQPAPDRDQGATRTPNTTSGGRS